MYAINSTADVSPYDSTLEKYDHGCTTVDQSTGELCGETETLTILNEFQRLYESRIEKVDRELDGEFERLSAKLHIMEEWIKDLGEQNIMLVHTVEDLEHAAAIRVQLLEDKLQHSSLVVTDNIARSGPTQQAICLLSNRVNALEREEEYLQQKIGFLKNDIKGLLELIRRARRDNCWSTDGITFIEIHPDEDLPAPLNCTCDQEQTNGENLQSLKLEIEQLEENRKKMIENQMRLETNVEQLSRELMSKEEFIKRLTSNQEDFYDISKRDLSSKYQQTDQCCEEYTHNMKHCQDVLSERNSEVKNLKNQLQKTKDMLSMINHEKNMKLSNLNSEFEKKCKECVKLTQVVSNIRKGYQQMHQVSKAEIRKRDHVINELKKKIAKLEDSCGNAKLNIDFNNGVIKEMRTVIKQLNCKDKVWTDEKKARLLVEEEAHQISNLKVHVERLLKNNNDHLNVTGISLGGKIENGIEDADRFLKSYLVPETSNVISDQDYSSAKCQSYNGTRFKRDIVNTSQLLQTIETTMQSVQHGLEEITSKLNENEIKATVNGASNMMLITSLIDKLNKYKSELSNCVPEIESLKHAVYSKDTLLSNMDEITKVQKDSIAMMQTELKELQEKLQEKIKTQDQTIRQYEKEKHELVKQNELQSQTIGHLQNAVVEAKRNIDHLGRKTTADVHLQLQEKDETIRTSIMCADEIERQYNECFTEAAEQHFLLDLQRDAINTLQDKIHNMEHEKMIVTTSLHNAYISVLYQLKEQLDRRAREFHDLKCKISSLIQSDTCLQNEEIHSRISSLIQEGESMKKELEKWKSCFHVITDVLNIDRDDTSIHDGVPELYKIKKVVHELRSENQQLKQDLENQIEASKCLQKRGLEESVNKTKEYLSEVNTLNGTVFSLQNRLKAFTHLLSEKSNEMAKLQADYEVLKNDNSILKEQITTMKSKTQDDVSQLRLQLNETLLENQNLRNHHERVNEELRSKNLELTERAKREVELQALLTETEKKYSSKFIITNQRLENLVDKLAKDLEIAQEKCTSRSAELGQFHEICNAYKEQINAVKQFMGYEREKVSTIQQTNISLKQKLEVYIEQNYALMEEKMSLQENNSKIVTELEEMHNSLLELKKKCLLKDESLASISAALTETAMSRTELCKDSQYVVHCIRIWMEDQKNYTDKLTENLSTKQQQLSQLAFEKKGLLANIRGLEDMNNILRKRLRKAQRCDRIAKLTCTNDSKETMPVDAFVSSPSCCNYARCMKVINISNNSANNLRRRSSCHNEIFSKKDEDSDIVLEENRDHGYQSCTSK